MEPEQKIINYFTVLKGKKIIGSSYLFIGRDSLVIGRLLKLINCTESKQNCNRCWDCKRIQDRRHPDLLVIQPEGISIKINQIREGIRFLSRKSYCAPKKNLIIKEAEKLTQEAANLFLKTLEEPPGNCFIGLVCAKLEDILPTIVSRCRKIYLPYSEYKLTKSEIEVKDILKSNYFSPKKRKDFSLFLESLIILLHNRLKSAFGDSNFQKRDMLFDFSCEETIAILEDLFKIYKAFNTVNINLALNLIQMRLRCN